jgi:cytosine/adenosine deaminase-related metal-dependent hydrolase
MPVVDTRGLLLLPGLVNAHDHLHRNVFPRVAPGRPYAHCDDWVADMATIIERPVWRRRRSLPLRARVFHGALKNALAGVTTVVHHDPWLPELADADLPITVVPDLGWAHSISLAGRYGPSLPEAIAATPAGRPLFLHLAEGTDQRAAAELGLLADLGGLSSTTRLVHGLGLSPADVSRALAAQAALVWCPASNAFLFDQVADPRRFAAAGLALLGTDSRLTGARDILDELAVAGSTGFLDAPSLLRLVTGQAGACVGRPAAGRLAVGGPADLVALADDGRPPAEQLLATRRADLRLVLQAGRPVVADPDFVALFDRLSEPWWPATLDGRPKLLAQRCMAPLLEAGLGERGLRILVGDTAASARTVVAHA